MGGEYCLINHDQTKLSQALLPIVYVPAEVYCLLGGGLAPLRTLHSLAVSSFLHSPSCPWSLCDHMYSWSNTIFFILLNIIITVLLQFLDSYRRRTYSLTNPLPFYDHTEASSHTHTHTLSQLPDLMKLVKFGGLDR